MKGRVLGNEEERMNAVRNWKSDKNVFYYKYFSLFNLIVTEEGIYHHGFVHDHDVKNKGNSFIHF